MSYPKRTLKLRPRKGTASDLPAFAVGKDFLTQGDNITYRRAIVERAPSFDQVYDPPSVNPIILLNTQIDGTNFWLYNSDAASFVVETSNHFDITHAGGLITQPNIGKLSLGLLNNVPFFNNSVNEPMYWDGNTGNNFLTLPDWTATETALFMESHRFHLFAFGIDGPGGDFPNQVKWSSAAAPGNVPASWTPLASNEAGDTTLSDTPGSLVSALNLRNLLLIYKTGSIHAAEYIGGQEVYGFRTLFTQAGALARHSVADINGRHFVVTDGDIILTDGVNIQSIAQDRRKRFFFNSLDQANFDRHFVVFYRAKNEVWLCFPEAGSDVCTRAMIYDVSHDAWGDRELTDISFANLGIVNDLAPDDTWDGDSEVWDADVTVWNQQSFSLAEENLIFAENATPQFNRADSGTETLTSTIAKGSMDFDTPERFKFIKRIHVRIQADTSIQFSLRVGGQAATADPVAWCSPVPFTSADEFVNVICMGRFISIEISVTTDKPFTITGLDIEAELRGYH